MSGRFVFDEKLKGTLDEVMTPAHLRQGRSVQKNRDFLTYQAANPVPATNAKLIQDLRLRAAGILRSRTEYHRRLSLNSEVRRPFRPR